MLSNFFEMLVLGTYWKTCYSTVSEQICMIDDEMDQSLCQTPNRDLREAHEKSLKEMEELKKFQGSKFDTSMRRRSVEDQDTILELSGKIQELQNEITIAAKR